MQLTEREQQTLEENQQILELNDNAAFLLWKRTRIEEAIGRIKVALADKRQITWDSYLCLWYRKEALEALLSDFDTIPDQIKALSEKALQEPDNSPATGALA
jgi:hypothetical protein